LTPVKTNDNNDDNANDNGCCSEGPTSGPAPAGVGLPRGHRPPDPPDARPAGSLAYVCARCGEIFYAGKHWHPVCRRCWGPS
jgi:hypothetical protein